MHLAKDTITLLADSTGNDTQYTKTFNGALYAIVYTPTTSVDTVISTTSLLTLNIEGATDNHLWSKTIGSTDMWHYYPRTTLVDSTGVVMGVTTDSPVEKFILSDERIRVSMTISTAANLTGDLDFYVEGSAN